MSRAPLGLAAPLVRVEVHLSAGLPSFVIVGLPEAVVRESKERVRAALLTSGLQFPIARITVNLSPADLPKEGGRFDLPIAIGILAASGQLPASSLRGREFFGELSLSGSLRETPKLLPALVAGIRDGNELFVPSANGLEAGALAAAGPTGVARAGATQAGAAHAGPGIRLADHLLGVCRALKEELVLAQATAGLGAGSPAVAASPLDLGDIRGQFAAKRALEIAAAGEHGLLLVGPPGAGKTLLAQCLPGLLPPLSAPEILEVASLESAAGRRPTMGASRPFRTPHHTASVAALIGGDCRPGEVSLAHRGVLFLDELPEFARNALEALREPLESGVVMLARAKRSSVFPARFQLVAAMNPCPCGYHGDPRGRCHCGAGQVARYRNRVSGPLLDRIDLHVELPALPPKQLLAEARAEAERSACVARRVAAARCLQLERQGVLNARLGTHEGIPGCRLDAESRGLLGAAMSRLGLSARAHDRIVKIARTCADLAGAAEIRAAHVAEAVSFRGNDRIAPLVESAATKVT
jgi:magnesium chelatase family protein